MTLVPIWSYSLFILLEAIFRISLTNVHTFSILGCQSLSPLKCLWADQHSKAILVAAIQGQPPALGQSIESHRKGLQHLAMSSCKDERHR